MSASRVLALRVAAGASASVNVRWRTRQSFGVHSDSFLCGTLPSKSTSCYENSPW